MILKCICINCKFYLSCWINDALVNFPATYNFLIKTNELRPLIKYNQVNQYLPTSLIIQLNTNIKNCKSEPDIVFCDGFIEQPGNWIL